MMSKIILRIAMFSVFLVSCVGREKQSASDLNDFSSNAPFIVEQITKPQNLVKAINVIQKSGLGNTFIVSLSTCLKDVLRPDTVIENASFVIEYKSDVEAVEKTKVKVSSNNKGCISWEEEYQYKYVVQPKWLVLKRTIKKEKGAYAGQEEVPLAINPWLFDNDAKFPEVLDLRPLYSQNHTILKKHPYEKDGLKYLSIDDPKNYPQLWAHKIDMQIETLLPKNKKKSQSAHSLLEKYQKVCDEDSEESVCYNRHLKVNITVPIELRSYDLQNQLADQKVNGGTYDISLQLLSIPDIDKKHYRIHREICSKRIKIHGDSRKIQQTKYISLSCDIPVSYFNQNAIYKTALEIIPKKGLPFKKFQGVYTINFSQSVERGTVQAYNIDSDLDEKYIDQFSEEKDISIIEDMKIESIDDIIKNEGQKGEGIGFDSVHLEVNLNQVRFSEVVNNTECSTNESVVKRQVKFIGEACIKDALTGNEYNKTTFRVFIEDSKTGEIKETFSDSKKKTLVKTDANGCISWVDTVEHQNFNREIYLPRKVHFLSEKLNLYGLINVAVNPWQRAFQAYQDLDSLSVDEIRTNSKGIDRPEMVINQFKSVNLFPSYILDKFLNPQIFHSLYFLFQPIISRHDDASYGRKSKSREWLRDGYYILRILLLRNPQETKDLPRVKTIAEEEKRRSTVFNDDQSLDVTKGRYLTHIDTIIKAEANFANVYMPLYFTRKQFLYLASRNMMSIELLPVDPSGFKFKPLTKDRDTCELDLEKTTWKPFFDHDLITVPYVGAYNAQNWTNWNILRPTPNLNTDRIIEANKEGKKYKFFNLHPSSKLVAKNKKPPLLKADAFSQCAVEGSAQDLKDNLKDCVSSSIPSKVTSSNEEVHEMLERRVKDQINKKSKKELSEEALSLDGRIKDFAKTNALRVVKMDSEEGEGWIDELKNSFQKVRFYKARQNIYTDIMNYLPKEQAREINENLKARCGSFLAKMFSSKKHRECSNEILIDIVKNMMKKDFEAGDFDAYLSNASERAQTEQILRYLDRKGIVSQKIDTALLEKINPHTLESIIEEGISFNNKDKMRVKSFGKAMCSFWFDSFYKDYLEAEQMQSAFMNYIQKFDYYQVLENDFTGNFEKSGFLTSFMNEIPDENTGLKKCHKEYAQCILVDHCQLREFSGIESKEYCEDVSHFTDNTCMAVLNKECKRNPDEPLCSQNISSRNCNRSLNQFCEVNPHVPVCYNYAGRCVSSYHNCSSKQIIAEDVKDGISREQIQNPMMSMQLNVIHPDQKESLPMTSYYEGDQTLYQKYKSQSSILKSCLNDPFLFFQFENKMFIDEISNERPRYVNGFAANFSVSANFSTGSYMNWTAQRNTSMSIKHGLGFSPKLPIAGLSLKLVDFDVSKGISSNTSNSGRRAIDVRVAEGAFLVASRGTFEIDVSKFQKCLVVRPSPHAFLGSIKGGLIKPYPEDLWSGEFRRNPYKKIYISRPGMMICNPKRENEERPETIQESYYYISQSMIDPSNSQFLNLYDLANRPFMTIFRGRKEFLKFYKMIKIAMEGAKGDLSENAQLNTPPKNLFEDYSWPVDEAVDLSLSLREFNATGFYPGVYNYNTDDKEFDAAFLKKSTWKEKSIDWLEKYNYGFPIPEQPTSKVPAASFK